MPADPEPRPDASRARSLADRVLAGELVAGARLMRLVDERIPLGLEALGIVHREGPEAPTVGITGAPGAGKSSLIDRLIGHHRAAGRRVGVVAVDPSSPLTGGAVLADRVRMQRHALDDGVFVRSLASRGFTGGLSLSASAVARILEGMRFDVVFLETVGVGQSEVDVARVADTVVGVFAPGLGDDVQAMKAGLLEVPDVFVVNKADREGADLVARDLEVMVHLGLGSGARGAGWVPPVLKVSSARGEGVDAVAAAIAGHRAHLSSTGALGRRRADRARLDVETALFAELRAILLEKAGGPAALDAAAARIAAHTSDPWTELGRLLGPILRPGA